MTVSFWFFAMIALTVWLGENAVRLLLAAAVHECGHLAAVFFYGGRVEEMRLGALGARIRPRFALSLSVSAERVMLAAGPAAGILAGIAALLFGKERFALLSIGLSLFNLLPLPGLDGGGLMTLRRKR